MNPVTSTAHRCCSGLGRAAGGKSRVAPQALWPGRGSWALRPKAFWLVQHTCGYEPRAGAGGPGRRERPRGWVKQWPWGAGQARPPQTCPSAPCVHGTHLQPRTVANRNLPALSSSALLSPHPCRSISRALQPQPPGLPHLCTLACAGLFPSTCLPHPSQDLSQPPWAFPASLPWHGPSTEELNTATLDHCLQGLGTGVPGQAPALEQVCNKQMKH